MKEALWHATIADLTLVTVAVLGHGVPPFWPGIVLASILVHLALIAGISLKRRKLKHGFDLYLVRYAALVVAAVAMLVALAFFGRTLPLRPV